jgi:hypothetical protein
MAQTTEQIPNLKEIMERERVRLAERRKDVAAELAAIDAEIAGIDAYFNAMTPSSRSQQPTRSSRSSTAERHPRGFVQQTVLKTITEHPQGMTTGELIAALKSQNIGQQSISNALGALVEQNKITSEGRGGKYRPATTEVPTAPDQPSSWRLTEVFSAAAEGSTGTSQGSPHRRGIAHRSFPHDFPDFHPAHRGE